MAETNGENLERSHIADWQAQVRASAGGNIEAFLSYFDTAGDTGESWVQGYWDFAHHILKPVVPSLVGEPFNATALEIGFGGGRLLGPASRFFGKVIGVDIHDNFDEVRAILEAQGIANAELAKGDGRSLPVPDQSIDFVYSFIVLQHLPLLSTLNAYFADVKRVLKPGKAACLYMGHLPFNWRGIKYLDLETRRVKTSRDNTLLLRPTQTRRMLKDAGLRVVEMGRPRKKPWRSELGEQHYAIVTA